MIKETRKTGICLFLLLFVIKLYSQIGVSTRYQLNDAKRWNEIVNQASPSDYQIFQSSVEFAMDYKIPFRSVRLELLPEVSISFANSEKIFAQQDFTYTFLQYGAGLKARVFPFDFYGDCSCPTFSKQGPALQKGLFIQFNAGAYYLDKTIDNAQTGISEEQIDRALRFGVGVGLDLGISEHFTLTPLFAYQSVSNADWPGFALAHGIEGIDAAAERSAIRSYQFELRFGFTLSRD